MAFCLALSVYVGIHIRNFSKDTRVLVRNFYGSLKVLLRLGQDLKVFSLERAGSVLLASG